MKRFLATAMLLAATLWGTAAQEVSDETSTSDFRARAGVDLSWKPSRRWKLSLNEELRMKNGAGNFDRLYSTLGVSFKPVKYVELEAGYTFATIMHDGKKSTDYLKYWDFRHRMFAGVELEYSLGALELSLRERYQATFRTDDPKPAEKSNPAMILRSRLKAEYRFRYIPIEPYAAVELSNTLNAPALAGGNYIEKIRYSAGLKYKFDRHSTIELYYRLDDCMKYDIDVKKDGVTLKSIVRENELHHIVGVEFGYRF